MEDYTDIIAIGCRCQAAHQVRRIYGIDKANIFDWLISTTESIKSILENDFAGLMSSDNLAYAASHQTYWSHGHVVHIPTNTLFSHDFDNKLSIADALKNVAPKYDFLAERWRSRTLESGRILFVHQSVGLRPPPGHDPVALNMDEVKALHAVLQRSFRNSEVHMLAIDENMKHTDQGNLSTRRVAQPDPWDWRGDNEAWESAMTNFKLARQKT